MNHRAFDDFDLEPVLLHIITFIYFLILMKLNDPFNFLEASSLQNEVVQKENIVCDK